jgi:hypothetical protein
MKEKRNQTNQQRILVIRKIYLLLSEIKNENLIPEDKSFTFSNNVMLN